MSDTQPVKKGLKTDNQQECDPNQVSKELLADDKKNEGVGDQTQSNKTKTVSTKTDNSEAKIERVGDEPQSSDPQTPSTKTDNLEAKIETAEEKSEIKTQTVSTQTDNKGLLEQENNLEEKVESEESILGKVDVQSESVGDKRLPSSEQNNQLDNLTEETVKVLIEKETRKFIWKMSNTVAATAFVTTIFWIVANFFSPWKTPPEVITFTRQLNNFCVEKNLTSQDCFEQLSNKSNTENISILNVSQHLDSTISNLAKITQVTETKHSILESITTNISNKLQVCEANNEKQTESIRVMKSVLENQGLDMKVFKGVMDFSDNSKIDKGTFFLVTFMLAVGEFCIFVLLWWIKSALSSQSNGNVSGRSNKNGHVPDKKGIPSVLDNIHRRKDLQNSLCILSFHPATQEKHCKMVNSFCDKNIKKKSFLLERHEDIKDIPAFKSFILFVDFNARNIILESNREMGNIKKTTVQAIWKTGAEVILVYCGDEYSQPDEGSLYNKRLASIKEHDELSRLESNQCVLTVNNDKFTEYQKKHLQKLTQHLTAAEN